MGSFQNIISAGMLLSENQHVTKVKSKSVSFSGKLSGPIFTKKAQQLAFESAKRFHLSDFQTSIIGPRHSHFWSKTCNFLTKYRIYKFPFLLAYLTEKLFRLFHHDVYFNCNCSDLSIQATSDSYKTS